MKFLRLSEMAFIACCGLAIALSPQTANAQKQKDRVARDFREADIDGNHRLSKAEWNRRGNFEHLDTDGDGVLSLQEVRAMYHGHDSRFYDWPPQGMKPLGTDIDPSVAEDRVERDALDKETLCGIGRSPKCELDSQKKRGLIATGTGPRFPKGMKCPGIDDYWAMDYTSKRNKETYHGGIDIPVPWGTPMRAVAAGSVVAKYQANQSKRGTELVLRHSPEQTGLPIWTYSAYGHLDTMPDLQIGQRLNMGDIIGPTGNSGISAKGKQGSGQSKVRRPAIHLAMFFSETNAYSEANNTIIPVNGYWLDPMAFYRGKGPFHSSDVKALPDDAKDIEVPVMLEDGSTMPAETKTIWPYACQRD